MVQCSKLCFDVRIFLLNSLQPCASPGRVLQALQRASHEGEGNGPECEFHLSHQGPNGGAPPQHDAVVGLVIICVF